MDKRWHSSDAVNIYRSSLCVILAASMKRVPRSIVHAIKLYKTYFSHLVSLLFEIGYDILLVKSGGFDVERNVGCCAKTCFDADD